MAYPEARLIQLDEDGWRDIAYEETEHFEVTRNFLNGYEGYLKRLLEED